MYKKYFPRSLLIGNFFSCMIACWFFNKYNNVYCKNLNNKINFNNTLILLTTFGLVTGSLFGFLQNNYLNEYYKYSTEELYQFSDDSTEESYQSSLDNETKLSFKKKKRKYQ